jgi:hypothetical protein
MQVGAPGNIDKGFCLKCKTPLVLELPDKIQFLCGECVKDVKAIVAASKGNPDLKRFVIQPGQYHRLPDGRVNPLRDLKRRKR